MYKIAVMGDKDSVYGFSALGLSVFPVDNEDDAVKILQKLANSDFGIIYITESLAKKISKETEKYKNKYKPAIILIPGITQNTGEGLSNVMLCVEKAVGSNILK